MKIFFLLQKYLGLIFVFFLCGCQFGTKTPLAIDQMRLALTQTAVSPTSLNNQPEATLPANLPLSLEAPWLAYLSGNSINIVHADGSGRTQLDLPDRPRELGAACLVGDPAPLTENSSNRMVDFDHRIYLIQPPHSIRLYTPWFSTCNDLRLSQESLGPNGLLLASLDAEKSTLTIQELPSGKVRTRFPLVQCAAEHPECAELKRTWQIRWSPDGRYLAFPMISNGTSTDLYVYDRHDGSIRQLTHGPEEVAQVWWSPDGSQIIFSEDRGMLSEENYAPAFWTVSIATDELRFLYTMTAPQISTIAFWPDNDRFVSYDGRIICCGGSGSNLRLVNIATTDVTMLFDGLFATVQPDVQKNHIYISVINTPEHTGGAYILSLADGTLEHAQDFKWNTEKWHYDLFNLYPTGRTCEADPNKSIETFDANGRITCLPPLDPTAIPDSGLSPDQHWQIMLTQQEGVLLKNLNDQSTKKLTNSKGTQVIWCPDSSCLFLVSNQILYHISLPSLVVGVVDANLGVESVAVKWINKP